MSDPAVWLTSLDQATLTQVADEGGNVTGGPFAVDTVLAHQRVGQRVLRRAGRKQEPKGSRGRRHGDVIRALQVDRDDVVVHVPPADRGLVKSELCHGIYRIGDFTPQGAK